jgi:hypothetical protein
MKHKIAVALVAALVVVVSLAACAEKQASGGKVFLLKSGGKAIAELRVLPSAIAAVECADSSGHAEYNMSTRTMVARGGAILKLTAGTDAISVRADQIESLPTPK